MATSRSRSLIGRLLMLGTPKPKPEPDPPKPAVTSYGDFGWRPR